MNERADAISSLDKPWAYVVLTRPDVTFLVVITTLAGFYLGSSGSIDWSAMLSTVGATMLVAGGTAALNQYVERESDAVMRRTASRPLPAGQLRPRRADFRHVNDCRWSCVAGICCQWACRAHRADDHRAVSRPVHAAEEAHAAFDRRRSDSRGVASTDRVGRGAWVAVAWRLGAFRHPFLLAVSALHVHRLDLPRGLRSRGNPHAAGGGPQGRFDLPPDRMHVGSSGLGERAALGGGNGGHRLLFPRADSWHAAASGGPVGQPIAHQRAGQMADARDRGAHSAAADLSGA